MRFELLGPFEVRAGEEEVAIAAPKQRAVLALLLLNRGRPVSVDRLAAELWGDEPPATATKTVQVYVAQLRKALGGVVVTHGRGYAIDSGEHEVDVDRFEQLAADGRRALEDGDARTASALLHDALGLWRGPPLADFTYEEFAQSEIARLEDERLAAVELRIEADLALGRHDALVPELRALVRKHPLRERLRGHLMLALYRCGRQAEALEEYRLTRKALVDELGLEPSVALQELERAILGQDESLGAPTEFRLGLSGRRRRGAVLLVAGGVLLACAAAAAIALEIASRGGGGIASLVEGSSVATIDPSTGRVTGTYPVGASPAAVAVGSDDVWVLSVDDRTVTRIDASSKRTRTIGIAAVPTDLAVGAGAVWVGSGGRLEQAQFAGSVATAVTRLDPRTGSAVATIPLPRPARLVSNLAEHHLAVASGSLWAISPGATLVRIDPRTNRVVSTVRALPSVVQKVIGADRSIWALDDTGTVWRIDGRERVTARVKIASSGLTDLAVGDGSLWATAPADGTLWRVDLGADLVQRTIDVGVGADALAFGEGHVWVTNSLNGTLVRVDSRTNRVDRTISIGNTPRAVAVGHSRVWVAVAGGADEPPSARGRLGDVVALPDSFCGQAVSGAIPPRFLVASDFPLQGGPRFGTLQMTEAVLWVLRKHHFRAGTYPLAYQSCDDSTAQTGLFDPVKCAANARAYSRDTSVIGVVGPLNSGCAYEEIPVANRADLAIVGPTTSDPGLTRSAFRAPRDALTRLYPTGRRTFARLLAPDDAEAAAAAVLAHRLGRRRVYVLHDGGYGAALAFYFRRAAMRLGEDVAGQEAWDPRRPLADQVAARVARSGADSVYLCGLIDTEAALILVALRQALPAATPVIGCSGLLPASLLFRQAGEAARGVYVALQGLVPERLDKVGREFVHDFGATQAGAPVTMFSVYAAQAAEVLLDAIARSDGTRSSVARELLPTRIRKGLLGSFQIDRRGDPVPTPVTILRLERPGGSNAIVSYDGARVESVILPERRLFASGGP